VTEHRKAGADVARPGKALAACTICAVCRGRQCACRCWQSLSHSPYRLLTLLQEGAACLELACSGLHALQPLVQRRQQLVHDGDPAGCLTHCTVHLLHLLLVCGSQLDQVCAAAFDVRLELSNACSRPIQLLRADSGQCCKLKMSSGDPVRSRDASWLLRHYS
jgi:hypothetical protein